MSDQHLANDLVARLREQSSKWFDDDSAGIAVMNEAADEIERLREALQMVADADDDCHRDGLQTIPPAARATIDRALGKRDKAALDQLKETTGG